MSDGKFKEEIEVEVDYPRVSYCPVCGSTSVEREDTAMEGIYHFNSFYCQDCGCPFKVLQKWELETINIAVDNPKLRKLRDESVRL